MIIRRRALPELLAVNLTNTGMALPRRDHRGMDAMTARQLRQRQLAPDRLQRNLRLELSPYRFRVLA